MTMVIVMTDDGDSSSSFTSSSSSTKNSCCLRAHVVSSSSQHTSSNEEEDTTATTMSSSSSSHSLDDSSRSSQQQQRRRVAFDSVDIVELSVELGDHPYCRSGPAVQTSGRVERRVSVTLQDYEAERSPIRRSASDLYLSSEDRMKLLNWDLSGILESLPRVNSNNNKTQDDSRVWSDAERRISLIDQRVDALLERMDILDQCMARRGRRRQQRQRARRATLVSKRTTTATGVGGL